MSSFLLRKSLSLSLLAGFLVAFTSVNLAQTATGSILGTVSDSTGAAVAGATVLIKAVSTGTTRTVTTSASGTYSAVALFPGEI